MVTSKDKMQTMRSLSTECRDGLKSGLNALQTLVIAGEWHCQTNLSQQLHLTIEIQPKTVTVQKCPHHSHHCCSRTVQTSTRTGSQKWTLGNFVTVEARMLTVRMLFQCSCHLNRRLSQFIQTTLHNIKRSLDTSRRLWAGTRKTLLLQQH